MFYTAVEHLHSKEDKKYAIPFLISILYIQIVLNKKKTYYILQHIFSTIYKH